MENTSLSRKDFREFNDSDWMGFAGAECPENGSPLIHEPEATCDLACVILCDNLIGLHYVMPENDAASDYYDEEAGELATWQMEVENQQQGLEIIGMLRIPTELPMLNEWKALEKLGFQLV